MKLDQLVQYQFLNSGMYLQEVTKVNGCAVVYLQAISHERVRFWIKFNSNVCGFRTDYLYVRSQDYDDIWDTKGEDFLDETMIAECMDSEYLQMVTQNIADPQNYHHFIIWTGEDRYTELVTDSKPSVFTIKSNPEIHYVSYHWG